MIKFLKIFFLALLGIFLLEAVKCEVRTEWLSLPLDHFNIFERRTFNLRYFVNEEFYQENGPILIYLADGALTDQFILEGNMFEIAQSEGAVLIAMEQRFFGESRPTPDTSFENLQWLTISQDIADIGEFARSMRNIYSNAPVIVWGRALGGALAVWARQRYPHFINGAWGSSAYVDAIVEDVNLLPNTINAITEIGGEDCGEIIAEAFAMIEEAFQTNNTTRLEERFMTCHPFDVSNSLDLARFIDNILYDMSKYGFLESATPCDVVEKCNIMKGRYTPGNLPVDALDAFARWYIDFFHAQKGTECIVNNNEAFIELYRDPSWESQATSSSMRQILWLHCTQFGQWFVTNNGQGHPFGTRVEFPFFQQWCADVFGNEM